MVNPLRFFANLLTAVGEIRDVHWFIGLQKNVLEQLVMTAAARLPQQNFRSVGRPGTKEPNRSEGGKDKESDLDLWGRTEIIY